MTRRTQQRPPSKTKTEKQCPACGASHRSYRRVTCSKLCHNRLVRSKTCTKRKRVYNKFLPPDAEENQGFGIPVPSPDEIEADKQAIRTLSEEAMRKQRSPPRRV